MMLGSAKLLSFQINKDIIPSLTLPFLFFSYCWSGASWVHQPNACSIACSSYEICIWFIFVIMKGPNEQNCISAWWSEFAPNSTFLLQLGWKELCSTNLFVNNILWCICVPMLSSGVYTTRWYPARCGGIPIYNRWVENNLKLIIKHSGVKIKVGYCRIKGYLDATNQFILHNIFTHSLHILFKSGFHMQEVSIFFSSYDKWKRKNC
jgi:hypothetical protein